MSSRQEEKAARRAEREAQEAAAARAAARSKRIQMALGALLVVAILGGSTYALTTSADKQSTGKVDTPSTEKRAAIPPVAETDMKKAAALAKCVLLNPPLEVSTPHVDGPVTYKSNPPTSGKHNGTPASDGRYLPGNEPAKENYVHSLEHGRIEIQYRPGTPAQTIRQLEAVGNEALSGPAPHLVLIFQNNTRMPYAVAATAWGHILGCKTMNPQVFDAVRAFRTQYTLKAPEQIPTPE